MRWIASLTAPSASVTIDQRMLLISLAGNPPRSPAGVRSIHRSRRQASGVNHKDIRSMKCAFWRTPSCAGALALPRGWGDGHSRR
jgi:hypothetical protein